MNNLYRMLALGNDPRPIMPACYEMWGHAARIAQSCYFLAIKRATLS